MRGHFISLAAAGLFCAGLAQGAVVYVDKNASGANDGTTWTNACTTLANALARVSDGDQVWVAQGVYTEGAQVTIANANLAIYGGFASGATDVSQRDATAHAVIVDGNLSYRCFTNSGANVTLDGLVIQRGRVGNFGAGICNTASGLVVRNCTITNCATTTGEDNFGGGGGGIFSSQPLQVLNSLLCNNTSSTANNGPGGGGIIFTGTGLLLVSNTIFRANVASDANAGDSTKYGDGGAIHMYDAGQLQAFNCTFDGNLSQHNESGKARRGGAVYLRNSSASGLFLNCTFYSNLVVRGNGGAIYSAGAPLAITNCIFWANTNGYYVNGAQVYSSGGSVSLRYSCLPGTATNDLYAAGTLTTGSLTTNNPLFANAAAHDFHLQSPAGRWTPGGWVRDAVTSPCIDAGDPASPYANEPQPNGGRINLGFEGNTAQASKTPARGTVLLLQ